MPRKTPENSDALNAMRGRRSCYYGGKITVYERPPDTTGGPIRIYGTGEYDCAPDKSPGSHE